MTLEEINDKYKYKSDQKWFDSWTGLRNIDDNLVGDCEDYCITLKEQVKEFKDWDYYYCRIAGIGHCVLIKGNKVIDCNVRRVVTLEHYKFLYTPTNLKKYNKVVLFCKLLVGKVFRMFK